MGHRVGADPHTNQVRRDETSRGHSVSAEREIASTMSCDRLKSVRDRIR